MNMLQHYVIIGTFSSFLKYICVLMIAHYLGIFFVQFSSCLRKVQLHARSKEVKEVQRKFAAAGRHARAIYELGAPPKDNPCSARQERAELVF